MRVVGQNLKDNRAWTLMKKRNRNLVVGTLLSFISKSLHVKLSDSVAPKGWILGCKLFFIISCVTDNLI